MRAIEFHRKIRKATGRIQRKNGSDARPSDDEIARMICDDCPEDDRPEKLFEKLRAHIDLYQPSASLSRTKSLDDTVGPELTMTSLVDLLEDTVGQKAPEIFEQSQLRETLVSAVGRLSPRERFVIEQRVLHGRMLDDLSEDVYNTKTGEPVTRECVRKIESGALKKLRFMLSRWYLTERSEPR